MKRSREEQIVTSALISAGIEITDTISRAVSNGLRQIRREKFEEHQIQKAKLKGKASPQLLPGERADMDAQDTTPAEPVRPSA